MACKIANKVVTWDEGSMVDGKNLWRPKNWICQKKVHTVAKNKAHTKFLVVHNFNFLITKTKVGSVGKTDDSTANTRGSRSLRRRDVVA